MNCLRCEMSMNFVGRRSFHEGTRWGFLGEPGELFVNKESFDVYACPQCGKVEFFVSGSHQRNLDFANAPFDVELSAPESATIPEHIDLLKLTPGEETVDTVYETIGHPIDAHVLEEGVVLCYLSADESNPHVVLIDHKAQRVRLVAIYNHLDLFTLEGLEKTYGLRELVGVIDGHEHWLFEGQGVAFIAEGRKDDDILYVVFIEPTLSLYEYQELRGFSREIFTCAPS